MAGGEEILVNYLAMEQLLARVQGLAESFSAVRSSPELSSTAAGEASLETSCEEFRVAWVANRESILGELEGAGQVLNEAVATYRAADAGITGTGAG